MDISELGEKERQLHSNAILIRYYRIIGVIITIALITTAVFAYTQYIQLKDAVYVIKDNQHNNSLAIETFIRNGLFCTATLPVNPAPTTASIQAEADKCFPDSRPIK